MYVKMKGSFKNDEFYAVAEIRYCKEFHLFMDISAYLIRSIN